MSEVYTDTKIQVGQAGEEYHFEIHPDADSNTWVEVRSIDHNNRNDFLHMVFEPKVARAVAAAMIKIADELEAKEK